MVDNVRLNRSQKKREKMICREIDLVRESFPFIEDYVRNNYDLTPKGIINTLCLLDTDYNKVSSYGHFGKSGLSWEM